MAGFVLPIISGLAGFLGGGKQQQQTTQSQGTQNTSGQGFTSSSSTPQLNSFQQALAGLFTNQAMNLNNQATNLTPYTTSGLTAIQGQTAGNQSALANAISARGLDYSPAALTPQTQNIINGGNQANQFLASIPLLQRQLQTQSLGNLMQAFQVQPYGTNTSGSTSQFGNTSTSQTGNASLFGNPAAGALSGLGAGLAGPSPTYTSNIGQILSALGLG